MAPGVARAALDRNALRAHVHAHEPAPRRRVVAAGRARVRGRAALRVPRRARSRHTGAASHADLPRRGRRQLGRCGQGGIHVHVVALHDRPVAAEAHHAAGGHVGSALVDPVVVHQPAVLVDGPVAEAGDSVHGDDRALAGAQRGGARIREPHRHGTFGPPAERAVG